MLHVVAVITPPRGRGSSPAVMSLHVAALTLVERLVSTSSGSDGVAGSIQPGHRQYLWSPTPRKRHSESRARFCHERGLAGESVRMYLRVSIARRRALTFGLAVWGTSPFRNVTIWSGKRLAVKASR